MKEEGEIGYSRLKTYAYLKIEKHSTAVYDWTENLLFLNAGTSFT